MGFIISFYQSINYGVSHLVPTSSCMSFGPLNMVLLTTENGWLKSQLPKKPLCSLTFY